VKSYNDTEIMPHTPAVLSAARRPPGAIAAGRGERTAWRFANSSPPPFANPIPVRPTPAPSAVFLAWCEGRGLRDSVPSRRSSSPAYVEHSRAPKADVTKQHSRPRQCLDWHVTGGVLDTNPAASVRGPTYVIKKGKTPVLDTEQTRALLEAIDTETIRACATAR